MRVAQDEAPPLPPLRLLARLSKGFAASLTQRLPRGPVRRGVVTCAVAFLAALPVGAVLWKAARSYRSLQTRVVGLEAKLDRIIPDLHDARLAVRGFDDLTLMQDERPKGPLLVFTGHAFGADGAVDDVEPVYGKPIEALPSLEAFARDHGILRVVFGGDTIYMPTTGALAFLEALHSRIPGARFVHGNHEEYWSVLGASGYPALLEGLREWYQATWHRPNLNPVADDPPEPVDPGWGSYLSRYERLLGKRYWKEDLGEVRLVYLHTETAPRQVGLDDPQIEFLEEALGAGANGNGGRRTFRYALVFLHHALWAGLAPWGQAYYENGAELARQWRERVLPILKKGRVGAVFAGDAGWVEPPPPFALDGVPHYLTGWPGEDGLVLPEWYLAELRDRGPRVRRVRVHRGTFWLGPEEGR